jgi:hypothetical protein
MKIARSFQEAFRSNIARFRCGDTSRQRPLTKNALIGTSTRLIREAERGVDGILPKIISRGAVSLQASDKLVNRCG